MNEAEYAEWMSELVQQGVYDEGLAADFIGQRTLFEEVYRPRIIGGDPALPGAVGFIANNGVEASDATELVRYAGREFPGRALYFESLPSRRG
jgi:hypothetical protein